MKHIFAIIFLAVVWMGLSAQTGWFNISFNQDRDEVFDILTEQGFKVSDETEDWVSFTNDGLLGLKELLVVFSDGSKVHTWSVTYDASVSEDFTVDIHETLNGMHGTDSVWDDYYAAWAWELDNGKGVYFYELQDETVLIEYTVFDTSVDDYWD